MPVGSGQLEVEDTFGRTATASYTVNPSSATAVEATWVETDATDCSAPCNGAVTVTPSGGTGPYTITWQDGGTGLARTGLCPEDYLFFITDSLGCQSQTYEASVSCVQTQNYFEVREHLNNCTQLSVQTYSMDTTQQLSQGDTISLNERSGCYVVMGMTTVTPSYTLNQTFADCAACGTPPTPTSYEVQTCGTQALTYYVSRNITLTPGQSVELLTVPGCYEVIGDSTNAITHQVSQVFATCADCAATPSGFVYLASSCAGTFRSRYFTSTIALAGGTIVKVATGPYAGECVTILSQNNTAPATDSLDVLQAYTDCASCQGLTLQVCTTVDITSASASFTYYQNQTGYAPTLSQGVYNICGSNFTLVSGNATFTPGRTICQNNFDCRSVQLQPSCHILNGGSTGTQFVYADSGGITRSITVAANTSSSICALINSVSKVNSSDTGTFSNQNSLCLSNGDCLSGGDPQP